MDPVGQMKPPFDWNAIRAGEKVAASLAIPSHADLALPMLVVRGVSAGPTLVVSAGVHGDEYEGVQTIFDVFHAVDPSAMTGSLVAVPLANPPAFWNGTRTSPIDRSNLARVFPGDPAGNATQAIAYQFDQRILSLADLYLDLHSAGVKWAMPTLVGYHANDDAAERAAQVFGAPVIWQHPSMAPGRTVSAAAARGVPSLYCEARGGGRIHPDDIAVYRRGVFNLLRHLGILDDEIERGPVPLRLYGDGNIDNGVSARQPGFLTPRVELLESVEKGQLLGTLHDVWGGTIEEFAAPRSGVVVLVHACPLVHPDEPLFLITGVAE
jgi:predicted deacylase